MNINAIQMAPKGKKISFIATSDAPPHEAPIPGENWVHLFINLNSKGLCPFNFFEIFKYQHESDETRVLIFLDANLTLMIKMQTSCEFHVLRLRTRVS